MTNVFLGSNQLCLLCGARASVTVLPAFLESKTRWKLKVFGEPCPPKIPQEGPQVDNNLSSSLSRVHVQ